MVRFFNSSLGGNANVIVTEPGPYTLVVTDLDSGCTSEEEITVFENINIPDAMAVPEGILDCNTFEVVLDGSNSTGTGQLEFEWQDENLLIIGDAEQVVVSDTGTYILLVTDQENGCTDQVSVNVQEDVEAPFVIVAEPEELNCELTEIILDAGASPGIDSLSVLWLDENGNPLGDSLMLEVSTPGIYSVMLTSLEMVVLRLRTCWCSKILYHLLQMREHLRN